MKKNWYRKSLFSIGLLIGLFSVPVTANEVLVGVSSDTEVSPIQPVREAETEEESTLETEEITEEAAEEIAEEETEETEKETPAARNGWKVAIDPGHQGSWVDMSAPEPSAPGSSEMKAKATTGTQGRYSGLCEYELNLGVSLTLKEELIQRGYEVVMTREDNDKAISNKERAEFAAAEHADILVRIHANGSDDGSVAGALTMVPSQGNPYVGHMYEDCYELGDLILTNYCNATGFYNLGVGYYDNMSGINWSTIPVTILEMGFMTNEYDDLTMEDEEFWPVMAEGIADGIDSYFEKREPVIQMSPDQTEPDKTESDKSGSGKKGDDKAVKVMKALHDELEESMAVKAAFGENWSASVVDLISKEKTAVNDQKMQAASLIKLYIAGAVYERYDELCEYYGQDYIDQLLYDMITVSDNTSANVLTNFLGDGDDASGREEVTAYCRKNGYDNSQMGRMLLASTETGDNYTSVGDCSAFLTKVYDNNIPHADDILRLLKHQERTYKIPAGLPEGIVSGNKTGELDDVENDVAIIFTERPYVLCVMSEDLQDKYDSQNDIVNLSSEVFYFLQQELK